MDDRERDEILWRLDERTERIDGRIERINSRVTKQDEALEDLDDRVTRNTTILTGITFGVSTLIMALAGKITALLEFLRLI